MVCVEKNGGHMLCEKPVECIAERKHCQADAECCDGMTCADPQLGKDSEHKVCLSLPVVSQKNDICFPGQSCAAGLVCEDGHCKEDKPLEWGKRCFMKDWAEEKKCADGLVCMPFKNRMVCGDPGLREGTNLLKKGAVCTIGDDTITCNEGYSCQTPSKKYLKVLKEKYGEDAALQIGQCKQIGAEEAIRKYREKHGHRRTR